MANDWLAETKKFFFEGVVRGWAGGKDGFPFLFPPGKSVSGLEGWREATYREPLGFAGYQFADRWGNDPGTGLPSGSMFITHWKIPVWGMWVGEGSYPTDVLPFLRKALMESYLKSEFHGGRGPARFEEDNLLYTNKFSGTFERFHGHEYIQHIRASGQKEMAGFHAYWGGSFLYLGQK